MSDRGRTNRGLFLWYGSGVVAASAVSWLAATLHAAGWAPVGILPLGIGILLGIALQRLAAMLRIVGRTPLLVGTMIVSLLTVLAQHAWLYQKFRREWHEVRAKSPEAALFRPESPWSPREYFARELTPQRAALWLADAALITVSATGTVYLLPRHGQKAGPAGNATPTPEL